MSMGPPWSGPVDYGISHHTEGQDATVQGLSSENTCYTYPGAKGKATFIFITEPGYSTY